MVTSSKKRSFLVGFMVSFVVLILCSSAWSQSREKLMSYMGDSYVLTIKIDKTVAQEFLDEEINPILEADGQSPLDATDYGVVQMINRNNLRDDNGNIIGNGENITVILSLVVEDPASPINGLSILFVRTFQNNEALFDYLVTKGIGEGGREASDVKISQEIEITEDGSEVKGKFKITDIEGTINFKAEFIAPEPDYTPLVMENFVEEDPYRLRFASAPQKIFAFSYLRATYEPLLGDALLDLNISVSGSAGEIFNNIDKDTVTRLRFMHQIMILEEIL